MEEWWLQPHSTAVAEKSLGRTNRRDMELEEHLRLRGAVNVLPLFGFQNSQYTGFCPLFKIYEPNPAETVSGFKENSPQMGTFYWSVCFPSGSFCLLSVAEPGCSITMRGTHFPLKTPSEISWVLIKCLMLLERLWDLAAAESGCIKNFQLPSAAAWGVGFAKRAVTLV